MKVMNVDANVVFKISVELKTLKRLEQILFIKGTLWRLSLLAFNPPHGTVSFALAYLGIPTITICNCSLYSQKTSGGQSIKFVSPNITTPTHTFSPQNPTNLIISFAMINELGRGAFMSEIVSEVNQSVTMNLKFSILGEYLEEPTPIIQASPRGLIAESAKAKHFLRHYISNLLGDTEHCDVTFIASDGTRLIAHKLVLCMQSEVFKTMLSANMSETATNEIVISDFEPVVVSAFVQFLYTDDCDVQVLSAWAGELLKMAHRYEVMGLQLLCETHLSASLTTACVVDRLLFAELYGAKKLKDSAMAYIVKHKAELIKAEPAFLQRLPVELVHELFMR